MKKKTGYNECTIRQKKQMNEIRSQNIVKKRYLMLLIHLNVLSSFIIQRHRRRK